MKKGIITAYVIVFGGLLTILLAGLFGFIRLQLRQASQKIAWQQSLELADAGLNRYLWCLNHGLASSCQGEQEYRNLQGSILGRFSLQGEEQFSCGVNFYGPVKSQGWTTGFPNVRRQVRSSISQPTLANLAYILASDVWVGGDHEIKGPYHSNGGIRFDGENQSLVSSARSEWVCTSSFGCSTCLTSAGCQVQSSNCVCPGVFTTTQNSNPDLFDFPATSFDFAGVSADLNQIKLASQTNGLYLPPAIDLDSQAKGYHLKFKVAAGAAEVEIWIVRQLSPTLAYSLEEGWHDDYFIIASEYLYQTRAVPVGCSVIFVEDDLWPEGQIKGKVTVVSADLINYNSDTDVVLAGNLDYSPGDGSDGLTLMAERNILIGPQSPNQMELRGIFLAQKGRFSRNHYPNNIRSKLEIAGSIASSGRVGTQWTSGSMVVSGYLERETYVDTNLFYHASPFTPVIDRDYRIINWQEE
jgi:hypothetical protein